MSSRSHRIYFAFRIEALFWTLVFSVAWILSGWDGTIHSSTGGQYGYGIHWSTLQNFTLIFYLFMVNVGVGGLRSPKQLWIEFKRDLKPCLMFWRMRRYRDSYPQPVFEGYLSFVYSFFATTAGFFVFEVSWVLLYNKMNFGDWLWPVYYTQAAGEAPNPIMTYIFQRNLLLAVLPLIFSWLILAIPSVRNAKGEGVARYRFKYRLNPAFFWLIALALSSWYLWIDYPFNHDVVAFAELNDHQVLNLNNVSVGEDASKWILPEQQKFPQTSYTFYPVETYMKGFPVDQIWGFYVDDPNIHFLNVLTKYLTTITVAYPLMIYIKERPKQE